jgi:tetratricopeptide (TPR) repeat protein
MRDADPDGAYRDVTNLLKLEPNHVAALTCRAAASMAKGDFEKAVVDCTRALRIDPKHLAAYYNRAEAYR